MSLHRIQLLPRSLGENHQQGNQYYSSSILHLQDYCSYTGIQYDPCRYDTRHSLLFHSWLIFIYPTHSVPLRWKPSCTDTFKALLTTVGISLTRTNTLLAVTTLILFPLCLLKNLSSLAPFSLLGISGMAYTAIAMAIRYSQGAYTLASPNSFLSDITPNLQPAFGTVGAAGVLNPSAFILICMLSTAYMAHFNSPRFLNELQDKSLPRFNTVVSASFGISIALFAAIASIGFLTFGSACSGLILNNYSNKDILMSLSRVAVAVSLVFSYPLAFSGCRDGVMDLLRISPSKRSDPKLFLQTTVAILSIVTWAALTFKDVSFVLSFGGATLGNALIYVYPALMFRGAVNKMADDSPNKKNLKGEVWFALSSAVLGIGMGAIGAKMAIQSAFG
jgi:amino acid permease